MKKLIIAALLVAGFGFSAQAQDAVKEAAKTKEAAKAGFIDQCKANMPEGMDADMVKKFCDCAADNVMEKMSMEELAQLDPANGDPSEETQGKLMQLIAPCMGDLQAGEE